MQHLKRLATALALILTTVMVAPDGRAGALTTNVDISQRHLNESEEAIAVNPTNPNNIVVFTNIGHAEAGLSAGMLLAVSFDGGATWTRRIVGNGDNLGDACCDPSLAFDEYGNLFMTYLYQVENVVPVALSTDGGVTFNVIANIAQPPKSSSTKASGDSRGLFRFVDQPTITAAEGEVWVVFNAGGPMFATGAPVTGLGQVGAFFDGEVVPGTNNCTYGDIAIGPTGQVMQVCTLTESGQGGGKVFVNVDPDGLGPAGFGDRVFVAATHVGGFDFIPPQPDRSVDAEPAWRGIEPAAQAAAGCTWCTRRSKGTRATTPTSTCATPTTTAPTGAVVSASTTTGRSTASSCRRSRSIRPPGTSPSCGTTRAPISVSADRRHRRHRERRRPVVGRVQHRRSALVHLEQPDQRGYFERPRLGQRHRLRRLQRTVVRRPASPIRRGRTTPTPQEQPGRRAPPTRHLHSGRAHRLTS